MVVPIMLAITTRRIGPAVSRTRILPFERLSVPAPLSCLPARAVPLKDSLACARTASWPSASLRTGERNPMAMMTRLVATAALLAMSAAASQAAPNARDSKALEADFDSRVSSADQLGWLKEMSSAPNHVGSPHDRANAEMELALFKQWGRDAHIETFQVLYPTPISTTLELVAPERITLGGQEPAVREDESSADLKGALPPYLAYQGDGDVTAPVVYVNYGMPDDYDALAARGISVRGKIVLARYGGGWRGLKRKLAQEHGAIGGRIYSDPADDGYGERDVYPRGGGRPEGGVQRGSVQDMR